MWFPSPARIKRKPAVGVGYALRLHRSLFAGAFPRYVIRRPLFVITDSNKIIVQRELQIRLSAPLFARIRERLMPREIQVIYSGS